MYTFWFDKISLVLCTSTFTFCHRSHNFFPLLLLPSIHPFVHSSIKPSIHQLPEDRNASPALLSSIWWACFSCICPVMPFFAPSRFTRWLLWLFYPSSRSFYFSEVSICNTWSIFFSNWSQVSWRFFVGIKPPNSSSTLLGITETEIVNVSSKQGQTRTQTDLILFNTGLHKIWVFSFLTPHKYRTHS